MYVYTIKGLTLAACSSQIAIGYFTIMSQFKLILAGSELNYLCCIKNGNRYIRNNSFLNEINPRDLTSPILFAIHIGALEFKQVNPRSIPQRAAS